MILKSGWGWKAKLAIVMLIIAIAFFSSRVIVSGDPEEVISYLWKQIGFIPVNILIVAFLIDSIISKKEHEAILEKIDMIMGTFFTKMGNDLLSVISTQNEYKHDTRDFEALKDWTDKDYGNKLKELKKRDIEFKVSLSGDERAKFLNEVYDLVHKNQDFLVNLIDNPNLLEKDEFSGLLLALLHLDEELSRRKDLSNICDTDFNHLMGDISRVYNHLVYEWVYYLRYLNKYYPYMISLAIRTNPFDCKAEVCVLE